MFQTRIVLLILTFLLSSCATPGGYTLLGTVVGGVAGVGMGLVADPGPEGRGRAQNVFAGSTIGALLGAGIGYLIEQNAQKKAEPPAVEGPMTRSPLPPQATPKDPGVPVLIPPRVDGHFVDDQVHGNIFVPGHFEYQIKENAKWQR